MEDDDIKEMIKLADTDGDDSINYTEFCKMMTQIPKIWWRNVDHDNSMCCWKLEAEHSADDVHDKTNIVGMWLFLQKLRERANKIIAWNNYYLLSHLLLN